MKHRTMLLLIAFLAASTFACKIFERPEPQYGKTFNEKRKEVGLPIIPDDWEIVSVHEKECTWGNPDREERRDNCIPVHWSKYLNYWTGTLVSETDTYYGREDYHLEGEGTYRERLTITYFYQEDAFVYGSEAGGWWILLRDKTEPTGKEISLEEAESILAEWGIDRLSYEFSSGN